MGRYRTQLRKYMMEKLILDSRRRWLSATTWAEAHRWARDVDDRLDMWLAEFGTQKEHTPR